MPETNNKSEKRLISWDLPLEEKNILDRQERFLLASLQDAIIKDGAKKFLQTHWFIDANGKALVMDSSSIEAQKQWKFIDNITSSTVSYLNHRWALISKSKRSQREWVVIWWYANLITYWNDAGWLTTQHKEFIKAKLATVDKNSISDDQQKIVSELMALCSSNDVSPSTIWQWKKDKINHSPIADPKVEKEPIVFTLWYQMKSQADLYDEHGTKLIDKTIQSWTLIAIWKKKVISTNAAMFDATHIEYGEPKQQARIKSDTYQKVEVVKTEPPLEKPSTPISTTNPPIVDSIVQPPTTIETNISNIRYVQVNSRLNTRAIDGDKVGAVTTQKLSKWDKIEINDKKTQSSVGNKNYEFVQVIKVNDVVLPVPVWVASKYLVYNSVSAFASKPKAIKEEPKAADKTESNPIKTSDKNEAVRKPESTEEVETEEERLVREELETQEVAKQASESKTQQTLSLIQNSIKSLWFAWTTKLIKINWDKAWSNIHSGVELKINKNYSAIIALDAKWQYRIWYSNNGWKNIYFGISLADQIKASNVVVRLHNLINTYAGKLWHADPAEIVDWRLVFDDSWWLWWEYGMLWDSNIALFPSKLWLSAKNQVTLMNRINSMHKPGNKESIWTKPPSKRFSAYPWH
jgi:hypothetical protein